MLEDGLERDHITVNTTIYCVIEQQLDNHKFIHEPMTTINRVSRDKSVPCTCPVVMVTVRAPRTQEPFPCIFFSDSLRLRATPNIVAPTILEVVACVLAVVCKRIQQLSTMLGPAVHCEKDTTHKSLYTMHNKRAWPQQCWKSCANGSNIVALRFGDHETKEMLGVVG